jgi:hypothetical protein
MPTKNQTKSLKKRIRVSWNLLEDSYISTLHTLLFGRDTRLSQGGVSNTIGAWTQDMLHYRREKWIADIFNDRVTGKI